MAVEPQASDDSEQMPSRMEGTMFARTSRSAQNLPSASKRSDIDHRSHDRHPRQGMIHVDVRAGAPGSVLPKRYEIVPDQVSERKYIVDQLRRQLDFTRAITNTLGEGLFSIDAEGCVTFMNPAAEQMLGWAEDELLGRRLHEVIHFQLPGTLSDHDATCLLVTAARSSEPLVCEHDIFTRKDGSVFPVAYVATPFTPEGELTGLVLAFRDVTASLRAEQERQHLLLLEREARAEAEAAQQRLAFLADASVVLSSSLDDAVTLESLARLLVPRLADWCELTVRQRNGSRRSLLAFASGAPAEVDIQEAEHTEELASVCDTSEILRTGQPQLVSRLAPDQVASLRRAHARPDDSAPEPGSYLGVPLVAHGRTLGALALYRRPTSLRYTEDDLSLGLELAQHAALAIENALLFRETREALDHRDAFLGIASHELKTPLTSLKVVTQLTSRHIRETSELGTQYAARMDRSIRRLERLINDLLDVSRIQANKLELRKETCDLAALCQQVADEQALATNRQIRIAAPDAPVLVEADPERIEQVLYNVLANALKYSAESDPVLLTVERDGSDARVSVTDTGIGIAREALPHLFERFYRAPGVNVQTGSGVGLGLGLFISHEVLERHGGRIWVTSEPGAGTTVAFSLPLARTV